MLGGQQILTDVSFDVAPGEVIALLGANGSGKSTMVRAALGVIPLTAGSVHVFGHPLGKDTDWPRVGYVPQRMPYSTGIPSTACEVVRAGLLSPGRLRLGSKRQALDALASLGMADRANQPVQQMSGGQQQRVLIARALIRQPDLLFLDEPASGIDLSTLETLVDTIDAMRQKGTSVVVVLHETEPFTGLIDSVVILSHGRVTHTGTPLPVHTSQALTENLHTHPHPGPRRWHDRFGLAIGNPE